MMRLVLVVFLLSFFGRLLKNPKQNFISSLSMQKDSQSQGMESGGGLLTTLPSLNESWGSSLHLATSVCVQVHSGFQWFLLHLVGFLWRSSEGKSNSQQINHLQDHKGISAFFRCSRPCFSFLSLLIHMVGNCIDFLISEQLAEEVCALLTA